MAEISVSDFPVNSASKLGWDRTAAEEAAEELVEASDEELAREVGSDMEENWYDGNCE